MGVPVQFSGSLVDVRRSGFTTMTFATTESAFPERISVLLVDGDADTRHLYGAFLRPLSVSLDEAADGREALAKALSRRYDIVVTDTRLPGINGYELCLLLRRDVATRATPIIILTGDGLAATLERARKAGADTVLVKPCLPDALLEEMRRLIDDSPARERRSPDSGDRTGTQAAGSFEARTHVPATHRRSLSRSFSREDTTTPPAPPPELVCPSCDQSLSYQRSHVGGVSDRHPEQWDYYECANGCGSFQYRQRTRKLRRVS